MHRPKEYTKAKQKYKGKTTKIGMKYQMLTFLLSFRTKIQKHFQPTAFMQEMWRQEAIRDGGRPIPHRQSGGCKAVKRGQCRWGEILQASINILK
jgi:hypothetical protein